MNEEEKKIIKKFVEKCNKFDESVEIKGVSVGEEYRILETVCKTLDLVEKLQKENEELNYKLHSKKIALEIYNRYIPKSKVEEKIEEIQKEYEETLKTANFKEIEKMNKINFRGITLEGQRSILRELLESRK